MTFQFPEETCGRGRLSHVGPIAVLCVEGTPEEVGRQTGELALRPAARILDYLLDLVAVQFGSRHLARLALPLLDRLGRRLLPRFPDAHRRELLALGAAASDERRVVRGNTLFDLKNLSPWRLFGCSSLACGPDRTSTGGPLLARNLDFFPLGYLHEFGLVTVYRSDRARVRPFAAVGFPGSVGVFSGMNDAGLAAVTHEVFSPPGRGFNPKGEPFAATVRRVLETCATVAEADALFRTTPRTTSVSVTVCDPTDQSVFELWPDAVARRDPERGAVVCANHFLGPARTTFGRNNPFDTLGRLDRLARVASAPEPLGVTGAWAALGAVSQGALTIQSMVFEPRRLALHVALGEGPATRRAPTELRLADFF
jgi:isopenicillin-N N-acyltransferase like protein